MEIPPDVVLVRFFRGPDNKLSARITDVMSKSTWLIADARTLWRSIRVRRRQKAARGAPARTVLQREA